MSESLLGSHSFSYRCGSCGRCCHNKRIQVGPYELFRLSRNRGLSTGEFAGRYIDVDGPFLRFGQDGKCPFLIAGACAVHSDRPLVCRLYPLGRHVDAQGNETFSHVEPHPQSEGEYGDLGTVAGFIEQQGALPYLRAADRYQDLFHRLCAALQAALQVHPDIVNSTADLLPASREVKALSFMEWLDIDATLQHVSRQRCLLAPEDADHAMALHIRAIELALNLPTPPGE